MSNGKSCLDLILEGERLQKAKHYVAAAYVFEAAVAKGQAYHKCPEDRQKAILFEPLLKFYEKRSSELLQRFQSQLEEATLLSTISVDENSIGKSYATIFGNYLRANKPISIVISEPNLSTCCQMTNLGCFIETIVDRCRNLRYLVIKTKASVEHNCKQCDFLSCAAESLEDLGIFTKIVYEKNCERFILFGGCTMAISDVGLDFYKPCETFLGKTNLNIRLCNEFNVEIYNLG